MARCISLLDGGNEPVVLHAMGAAISLCCTVALAVQRKCAHKVTLAVRTTTVDVYDDYEPVVEVRFFLFLVFCFLFASPLVQCCVSESCDRVAMLRILSPCSFLFLCFFLFLC